MRVKLVEHFFPLSVVVTVSVEPTTFTVEESAADNNELVFTLRKVGVAVRDVKVALVSSSSGTSTGEGAR